MTKRRRRLVAFLALTALAGVLAVPAVHWRLIGWAKREPFWRGRPASYWRAEVANGTVCFATFSPDFIVRLGGDGRLPSPPAMMLRRKPGELAAAQKWLAEKLGLPEPTLTLLVCP